MKAIQSFLATAFAITFITMIAVYGSDTARHFAVMTAFAGFVSQYVVQDKSKLAQRASIGFAYAGMFCAIGALVTF